MPQTPDSPHWNFEAFRNFIGFAPIQQACTSLLRYDGITLQDADIELRHLNHLLLTRTGHEWTPDRNPGGQVLWETEGSLFRNKKRVFTGFYLIDAESYDKEGRLVLTPFGRAIANGLISEPEYYRNLIQRFRFPHPAYEDNWKWWTEAKRELRPLSFILRVVMHLSTISHQIEVVSIRDIAHFGGPNPSTIDALDVAHKIKTARDRRMTFNHSRSDALDRKIGDMFAFLAMTPWAAMRRQELTLNPIRSGSESQTAIWLDLDSINQEIAEVTKDPYEPE